MRRRTYLSLATAGIAGAVAGCGGRDPADGTPVSVGVEEEGEGTPVDGVLVETVAADLEVPWGATRVDGDLHLTERPGRVVRVTADGTEVVHEVSVRARGEGGLLGLERHPEAPVAYTYQTYAGDRGTRNRVVRHDLTDGWAGEPIVVDIPGAARHDGGRLLVHDGALYVTCGDATSPALAQDRGSLAGKVLRLTLDGRPHPDNPFGNAVFTYGHRNPQGLAVRPVDGALVSTEHGPATDDEVNVLVAGRNYGWPTVRGTTPGDRYADPVTSYTPTIAPGGAAYYPEDGPIGAWQGSLFFGTLAGEHLHRLRFDELGVTEAERLFEGRFGRLRTTFVGPDGHLYATTSNRDGRGSPEGDDDRVLRFRPA